MYSIQDGHPNWSCNFASTECWFYRYIFASIISAPTFEPKQTWLHGSHNNMNGLSVRTKSVRKLQCAKAFACHSRVVEHYEASTSLALEITLREKQNPCLHALNLTNVISRVRLERWVAAHGRTKEGHCMSLWKREWGNKLISLGKKGAE